MRERGWEREGENEGKGEQLGARQRARGGCLWRCAAPCRTNLLEETVAGCGVLDVVDADVDALGNDPVLDALVGDDADGAAGHVEHAASLPVVSLVGHTLLLVTRTLHSASGDSSNKTRGGGERERGSARLAQQKAHNQQRPGCRQETAHLGSLRHTQVQPQQGPRCLLHALDQSDSLNQFFSTIAVMRLEKRISSSWERSEAGAAAGHQRGVCATAMPCHGAQGRGHWPGGCNEVGSTTRTLMSTMSPTL